MEKNVRKHKSPTTEKHEAGPEMTPFFFAKAVISESMEEPDRATDLNVTFRGDRKTSRKHQIGLRGAHCCSRMCVNEAKPGQIVVEILRGNTLEAVDPLFKPAVERIYILDMVDLLEYAPFLLKIQLYMVNSNFI